MILSSGIYLTWMVKGCQTEIHLRHKLPTLVKMLCCPGLHFIQGLSRNKLKQPWWQKLASCFKSRRNCKLAIKFVIFMITWQYSWSVRGSLKTGGPPPGWGRAREPLARTWPCAGSSGSGRQRTGDYTSPGCWSPGETDFMWIWIVPFKCHLVTCEWSGKLI